MVINNRHYICNKRTLFAQSNETFNDHLMTIQFKKKYLDAILTCRDIGPNENEYWNRAGYVWDHLM